MSRRHPDQHDDPTSRSLHDLAREAGVTTRTIRYYIAEGLLPPPESIGRNARYAQTHFDRLRLIGHLKEQYLPLKEIRARIASMSPEEVRDAVSRLPATEPPSGNDVDRAHPETVEAPDITPERSWKRIPISAEAELLITDDAWDRRGDRIQSAITWIRRMLHE